MTDKQNQDKRKSKRISKRQVDALKPGDPIIWDGVVKGFGVRCQRDGKFYILKARSPLARSKYGQCWFTIGRHGSPWTPEDARTEALNVLGAIKKGKDPEIIKAELKGVRAKEPYIKDFAQTFLSEHVDAKRKSRTAEGYRDVLERIAIPTIGTLSVADISRADIAKLHHSQKDTPYQANRLLAVLSKMFSWAERNGYRAEGTNPCKHVDRYPEQGRERYLSEHELATLADVLTKAKGSEGDYIIAAIQLLIFTGARLGEILSLKWEHVDLEQNLLALPDSKTGKKSVYLSAPALDVLANLPRIEGNPHVICGKKEGAALVNLQKPWRRIRNKATLKLWANDETLGPLVKEFSDTVKKGDPALADIEAEAKKCKLSIPKGLTDVRLHDLRHSFASVAASGGMSLPMIGKLLGHTQAATTARYAHLADDPIRAANEAIGEKIVAAMKGKSGEVVKMPNSKA